MINASLLGVAEELRGTKLLGAMFGAAGLVRGDFVELTLAEITRVARAPSSAIGTSRKELTNEDLERILTMLRAKDTHTFFYTGGNGSMGTAHQLACLARATRYELQVIGIPKTIDNDLTATDHAPGFGSAARFFACAARDLGAENWALPGQVEILEVLGRNAGWLAAATSLARDDDQEERTTAPHLIYFPENPLSPDQFLADVEQVFSKLDRCVVVVCEGQLDPKGEPFGADVRTGSRGFLAMNLGHRLALLVNQQLRLRSRSEKPGLLGRCSSAFISEVDWAESRLCGKAAALAAKSGETDKMVTLRRLPGDRYSVTTSLTALEDVAYVERLLPAEWRNAGADAPLRGFRSYAEPLTGSIEKHPRLKIDKEKAK